MILNLDLIKDCTSEVLDKDLAGQIVNSDDNKNIQTRLLWSSHLPEELRFRDGDPEWSALGQT